MARFSCNDTCQYGGWCLRILLTFCGMLLFLGTGLCIAGFAVFGYTNPRIDTVNQYNTRGAAFEARAPQFGSLSMSIVAGSNSWAAMPATTLVDVAAPTTGVKEFASRAFVAANVPRSSLRSAALRAIDNTSTVTSLDVPIAFAAAPLKRRVAKALQCTRADCGSGSNCQCSTTDMTRKCLTNYNGSWTPDKENGYCQDDERDCGYCEYEATLTALCIPVAFNVTSKSIVPSTKFATCDYPFGSSDGTYGGAVGSTDLVVTIMDETDPYIELQRLTKGTKSFGWDEKSQTSVATGLLVAGLVVLSLTIFAICLVVRSNSERVQEAKEAEIRHMHDATEMQPVVAAAPLAVSQQQQQPTAYPVAPAYPQPQPAYPQPQAPYPAQPYPQPGGASASAAGGAAPSYYGQQQGGMAAYPAYGQMQQQHGGYGGPQPAYGAPQPAYGAQPNYYGGPQPGYGAQQPQYGMAPQQRYPPQQVAPQGASSAAASPPRDDNAPRPKVV